MKYTLLIKEDAILDISEAFKWYEEKSKDLGDEFLGELDEYFYHYLLKNTNRNITR
jgi:hypothetical protein